MSWLTSGRLAAYAAAARLASALALGASLILAS
jgi:hypothetical protein